MCMVLRFVYVFVCCTRAVHEASRLLLYSEHMFSIEARIAIRVGAKALWGNLEANRTVASYPGSATYLLI